MKRMIAAGRITSNAGRFEDQREVVIETEVSGEIVGYRVMLDTDMPPEEIKEITSFAIDEMFIQLSNR